MVSDFFTWLDWRRVLLFAALWLVPGATLSEAEEKSRITDVSITPSGNVRLKVDPALADPDLMLLQSSDSPGGPWWKEPDFQRNPVPGGYEFLTPKKAHYQRRFYRLDAFSPFGTGNRPSIRVISPNDFVGLGQSVTLLGANFASAPAGNTVKFELPNQTWTAAVTEAAPGHIMVTVPADLQTETDAHLLYRVTVTTSNGTSNGVGCSVFPGGNSFMLRPREAWVVQAPGTGKETLAIGGGVPPYHLVPQTADELAIAVAQLNGSLVEITAVPGSQGSITVKVQDSEGVLEERCDVYVQNMAFDPGFEATFQTLLPGSAPGFTMTGSLPLPRVERTELLLQNLAVDVSHLAPGAILGLLKIFDSGYVYAYEHLVVREVSSGRANFNVVTLKDGNVTVVGEGQLIENPPTVVLNVPDLSAASLMPAYLQEEIIFADNVFHLPEGLEESFTVDAVFTSVSMREDKYLPLQHTVVRQFTTSGLPAGSHLQRLLPAQGEVGRNVRLRGTGFAANPANNRVTFPAPAGGRVAATILQQSASEIVVTVPKQAVSGPVQVTSDGLDSNEFLFSVFFHPETELLFDSFTANTPTALRLIHQQPYNTDPYAGEVTIQSVIATLDTGRLALSGLTLDQQIGTAVSYDLSGATTTTTSDPIKYRGQEPAAPGRHIFEVGTSPIISARIYVFDDPDGTGAGIQLDHLKYAGFDLSFPGQMWEYQFTTPIYRPPAAAGANVLSTLETISKPWMSPPSNEMRVIRSASLRVH